MHKTTWDQVSRSGSVVWPITDGRSSLMAVVIQKAPGDYLLVSLVGQDNLISVPEVTVHELSGLDDLKRVVREGGGDYIPGSHSPHLPLGANFVFLEEMSIDRTEVRFKSVIPGSVYWRFPMTSGPSVRAMTLAGEVSDSPWTYQVTLPKFVSTFYFESNADAVLVSTLLEDIKDY